MLKSILENVFRQTSLNDLLNKAEMRFDKSTAEDKTEKERESQIY